LAVLVAIGTASLVAGLVLGWSLAPAAILIAALHLVEERQVAAGMLVQRPGGPLSITAISPGRLFRLHRVAFQDLAREHPG
jgi:hypothetical protein